MVSSGTALRWVRGVTLLAACCCGGCDEPSDCACRDDPPRGPLFDHFEDATSASGIDFRYATPDFKAGALAVADLDGDGLPEILAARRLGGLALYHNRGGLRFREITAAAGLDPEAAATAVAAVDLDNDGDRDLVLAGLDTASVMANRGDGTFEEVARFDDSGFTEQVLAADLDGDGLLDLYFSNYDLMSLGNSLNRLYLNRGGLGFAYAGPVGNGNTWTATAFDFDGDGDQDLYVANDTLLADFGRPVASSPSTSTKQPDLFLRNDGPGDGGAPRFTNIAPELGLTRPRSSMGGLVGDFDDDGRLDLYVPDWGSKKLFVRDPSTGGYVDRAPALGADAPIRANPRCPAGTEDESCLFQSWGTAASDFDLDGHDELVVVSGETEPGRTPPVVVLTRGADPVFHEVSSALGCLDARGLVVTDLDGDGDQDVVISQKAAPLKIFETVGRPAPGTWLRVELRGRVSNREGVGAVVTAHHASGRAQVRVVGAGGVINSSSPAEAFFGLGGDAVQALEVQWPSGHRTEVASPPAGASLIVEEE